MKDTVINSLPNVLKKYITTLKRVSLDEAHHQEMCDSAMSVINFDKVPNEYAKGRGWMCVPKSNDALYIAENDKWFFIEFKNGSIKIGEIYRKLYDSIIMLLDMHILPDFDSVREKVSYILVYNEHFMEKNQRGESQKKIYGYVQRLAEKEEVLFGLAQFKDYLLREVHTWSKDDFEKKFVWVYEGNENKIY